MTINWTSAAHGDLVRLYEFLRPVNLQAAVRAVQRLTEGPDRFCRSKGLRLKSACVARLFKRPVSRTGWQRTRLCLVGSTALF